MKQAWKELDKRVYIMTFMTIVLLIYIRFSWALAIFALSIALSFVGGLKLVQNFAIVLGFPLIFVVILVSVAALRVIREDYGDKTKEEIIEEFHSGKEDIN